MRVFGICLGITISINALICGSAIAAVPSTMSAQGRLLDSSGTPLSPGFKSFTFVIFSDTTGGTLEWTGETQFISTSAEGLWNARLGAINPLTSKVFSDPSRWLEITVDDGVNPAVTMPRTRLLTSPYAFHAEEAERSVRADSAYSAQHAVAADTAAFSLSVTPDDDWIITDSILYTHDYRGLVRGGAGNLHYGDSGQTIVNLGTLCTTGQLGSDVRHAVISGGWNDKAAGDFSTVSGGYNNQSTGDASVVSGGEGNVSSGTAAVSGGGWNNTIAGDYATIAGGLTNHADGVYATVAGGWLNAADGPRGAVLGGSDNHASGELSAVGGGAGNDATNSFCTIGGGSLNLATGINATVPGGLHNRAAGTNSFAAGAMAKAKNAGSVVIAANSSTTTSDSVWSTGNNQFVVRADAGIYLAADSGGANIPLFQYLSTWTGAYLSVFGAWTNSSDETKKENFTELDSEDLLKRIDQLRITRWNYIGDPSTHIGPTAQQFHEVFGVGQDSVSICTIDPGGIALAAIQELDRRTQRIDVLAKENEELRSELNELREKVAQLASEK